jgi:hypothetical protein
MPTDSTMLYARSRPKTNRGGVNLTTCRLIELSVSPIGLWTKVIKNIDRAITWIRVRPRDEAWLRF